VLAPGAAAVAALLMVQRGKDKVRAIHVIVFSLNTRLAILDEILWL
jgi:hypothetical protein